MASRRTGIRHIFAGGLATDFGPSTTVEIGADGIARLPFLTRAENIVYELDGGIRKAPGAAKINASALESGAVIHGAFDCWFSGTTGSATQHRIISIGAKIKKDDADGTFTDLFTGLSSGAVPSFAMLEDLLIIGLHSTDVPKSWDGSTAQNLAGSPPNFGIVTRHKNRLWAADVWAYPSRLYYSPLLDPENTTAEGWGHIDIDPDDGDVITGLYSHLGDLIVFKGPYVGSIHRIQGSAPTGSDAFRKPDGLKRGVSAAWQNLIFPVGDDLGFMWANGTVHTLKAVEAYGDYNSSMWTRPIQTLISRINFARMKNHWAATGGCRTGDTVLFSLSMDGASANNFTLGMDNRFDPPRWFTWPAYENASIASMVDASASNRRCFMAGGTDGFVRKYYQLARVIDESTPISMHVKTPAIDYNEPFLTKTLGAGYLEFVPKNAGDIGFFIRRDSQSRQDFSVSQGAGDPLGTVAGTQFTLGTSELAAGEAVKSFFQFEDGGDFRQIIYEFENDEAGEDVEIHSFGISIEVGAESHENDL